MAFNRIERPTKKKIRDLPGREEEQPMTFLLRYCKV
jgi:hypothetical protein